MQTRRKLKIGEILVQDGLLTQEQVAFVLAQQKARPDATPFGELCVELGLVSPSDFGQTLRKHHRRLSLGELLIHLGLVSQDQIEVALTQQKDTKKKLGALLVEQEVLTETALVKALYQQAQSTKRTASRLDELLSTQRLNQEDLDAATLEARKTHRSVESVLIEYYDISKKEIGKVLSTFYSCLFLDYNEQADIDPSLVGEVNLSYFKANYWIPLTATKESVDVLIDDPHSFQKLQDIQHLFPGKEIHCFVGLQEDILRYINDSKPSGDSGEAAASLSNILGQLEEEEEGHLIEEEELEAVVDENDSAIVRLVNQIITDAYERGVSDIHIEPYGEQSDTVVRFRIDGACHQYLNVPAIYRRAMVSRIKIMAQMDIAERRKPQDGKLRFRVRNRDIELRVATVPTAGTANEDIVMRILSASKPIPLAQLKMSERNLREFQTVLEKPYGMILCVGPTGSGKTTTLHSALGQINTPERKIWTAEDPVEITQHGLRQVQVQPKIGFDFSAAMRSFLRADPDVIMVGEIRDQETAETAIEASLTGHLVLSTLHTNSAVETVVRLLDMGMNPFNFADALLGILAQRLTRTLCQQCKEAYRPTREEYDALALGYGEEAFVRLGIKYDENFRLHRGTGCEQCSNTGYRGRLALHEFLVATDIIKSLIHAQATVMDMFQAAIEQGMTTLLQDGIHKILQGWTDFNQVRAVALK